MRTRPWHFATVSPWSGAGDRRVTVASLPSIISAARTPVFAMARKSAIRSKSKKRRNAKTDEKGDREQQEELSSELSRRAFVAMSLTAGIAVATVGTSAAGLPVVETNVEVKTPDGT